jgi:hypothetical protein
VAELFKSAAEPEIQTITAAQDLTGVPEIRLSPNRTLRGPRCRRPVLQFAKGAHGLCLTSDNLVADLQLVYRTNDWLSGTTMPVGRLIFRRGIETHGAIGQSLVKGVLQNLPRTALSIKPGGSAQRIQVLGGLRSHGQDVLPFEQHGSIEFLRIEGESSSAKSSSKTA